MPAPRHCASKSGPTAAVRPMIRVRRFGPWPRRICRVASSPSITGICRSIRMTSKGRAPAWATASAPSDATATSQWARARMAFITSWLVALSSTSRICRGGPSGAARAAGGVAAPAAGRTGVSAASSASRSRAGRAGFSSVAWSSPASGVSRVSPAPEEHSSSAGCAGSGSARMRRASSMPVWGPVPDCSCPSRSAARNGRSRAAASRASASPAVPAVCGSAPSAASWRARISRLIGRSSTTSTRSPASAGGGGSAGAAPAGSAPKRARKVKRLPLAGQSGSRGAASTPPPISSARRRQIARPSPVPPYLRRIEASAWVKRSNRCGMRAGSRPTPVSVTWQVSIQPRPGGSGSASSASSIQPRSVNFTALPTRLNSTCRKRPGSPSTRAGRSAGSETTSSTPRAAARGANSSAMVATSLSSVKGRLSSSTAPASSLEKSRMSFSTSSRCSAEFWIVSA